MTFIFLICAIIADLIVPLFLTPCYPGYNHFRETISELANGKKLGRLLSRMNLIFVGLLFFAHAFAFKRIITNLGMPLRLYLIGIFVFAIGCILAGIFPDDPKGVSESASGKIHGIASGIGFLLLLLNPLWAIFIDRFAGVFTNILFLIFGIFTFMLFVISENVTKGWLQYTGLFQRVNLIGIYGCLMTNTLVFFN